jgi:hypothetical protein
MPDSEPPVLPIPTLGNLQDFAKATPALVAILVLVSLCYEASFVLPIGLGFLSFYTWQDFLHRAVVWLPILLIWRMYGAIWTTQASMFVKQRKVSKDIDEKIKQSGIKFRRFQFFWPALKDVAKIPYFYAALLFLGLSLWQFLLPPRHFGIGMVFGLIGTYFSLIGSKGVDEFAQTFTSLTFNRKVLTKELLWLVGIAILWGGFAGRSDIANPETTQIEVKSDAGPAQIRTCNVFRELNSIILAVCDHHVTALNMASIISIRYDIDVSKKL